MINRQRLLTALIGSVLGIGVILYTPAALFEGIAGLVGLLAFNEYLRMYRVNSDARLYGGALMVAAVACASFLFHDLRNLGLGTSFAPLVLLTLALSTQCIGRKETEQLGLVVLGGFYSCSLSYYFVALRDLELGKELILVLCLATWLRDVSAYSYGRLNLNGHVILPLISARKTYEGAVFAALATIIGTWAAICWSLPAWGPLDALALGIIVGILGQIGDLLESWLKRNANVKDSSQLLPGQGGILDTFDSFVFTAPAMYFFSVLKMGIP